MKRSKYIFSFLLVLGVLSGAWAQDSGGAMNADEVMWGAGPPHLPAGAEIAVLEGDPSQAVHITLRLRFPSGYEIPAHWHPTQEHVTVLSGSLNVGMGDVLDKGASTPLMPGGFVALGADMNHYVWTDEETIVQMHMDGPFEITYVDPATDPRNQ